MDDQPYTLARWRVRPGEIEAFIAAWHDLAEFFLSLKAPPHWGTLLQSADDPLLFYSFGPWPSMETIAAMRGHPGMPGALGKLTALCEESETGVFLVAASAGEGRRSDKTTFRATSARAPTSPGRAGDAFRSRF